jgi:hypothetical protein
MPSQRPPLGNQQPAKSIAHQAAKASWVCPIVLMLLLGFGRNVASPLALDLIALLLIVVGFVLGIAAAIGIGKYGAKGILAPAICGILINGLLLSIFVTNFLAARARAGH